MSWIKNAFAAVMLLGGTNALVDGNLVTGQNQNSGYETSHRILELLAGK